MLLLNGTAHVVYDWGIKLSKRDGSAFRPEYGKASILRARFRADIPVLAVSATLCGPCLPAICKSLGFGRLPFFALDAGRHRNGCSYDIQPLRHPLRSMLGLAEMLPSRVRSLKDIPIALVYVNTRAETRQGQILRELAEGSVRVVLCTEALGMGIDLPIIDLVVQWRLPRDFKDLVQHFGRGARGPGTKTRALLLCDDWVHQAAHGKTLNSSLRARWEQVDPLLREWLSTSRCKRRALDELLALDFKVLRDSIDASSKTVELEDLTALCQDRSQSFFWRMSSNDRQEIDPGSDPAQQVAQACCISCGSPFDEWPRQHLPKPSTATNNVIHLSAPPPAIETNVIRQDLGMRLMEWRRKQHEASPVATFLQEQVIMADSVLLGLADRASRVLARRLQNAFFNERLVEMLLGSASGVRVELYASLVTLLEGWAVSHAADPVAKQLTVEGFLPRTGRRAQASTSTS
ncbi:hypothetical protein V8E36_006696 [Tilletia maclaganii]